MRKDPDDDAVAAYFPHRTSDNDYTPGSAMHRLLPFQLGQWNVHPKEGELRSGAEVRKLQPKVMDVLCRLAAAPGELVSRDELVRDVWDGRAVSDEPLNRCIAELRNALGDDRNQPRYIETLPRRGYRLLAPLIAIPAGSYILRMKIVLPALLGIAASFATTAAWNTGQNVDDTTATLLVSPLAAASDDAPLLADAFTGEILNALAQAPRLLVFSRATTFSLRAPDSDPLTVARRLGADYLVEGALRSFDDKMRLTVQLIRAKDGLQVFARDFVYPAQEVARLIEDVARSLAHEIDRTLLLPRPVAGMDMGFPEYRDFLEAQHLWRRAGPGDIAEAILRIRRVVSKYPDFAAAHSQLAYLLQWQSWHAPGQPDDVTAIRTHRDRALALDPDDPVALMMLADASGDPLVIDHLLRRALNVAPHFSEIRLRYASHLLASGYLREAERELAWLHARDPLSTRTAGMLATLKFLRNAEDPDIDHLQQQAESDAAPRTRLLKLRRALNAGNDRVVAAALVEALTNSEGEPLLAPDDALALAEVVREPERPEAIRYVEALEAAGLNDRWRFYLWNLLEESDRAMDVLQERPGRDSVRSLTFLFWDAQFAALRADPRFAEWMQRLGFVELWRKKPDHDFCTTIDGIRCR